MMRRVEHMFNGKPVREFGACRIFQVQEPVVGWVRFTYRRLDGAYQGIAYHYTPPRKCQEFCAPTHDMGAN